MKTLLISTDFSKTAAHAAMYGYNLARHFKANIILCNAVIVPAEIPEATAMIWPIEEYAILMEESNKELKSLKAQLEGENNSDEFNPSIKCLSEDGLAAYIINDIVEKEKADMVIIGTHGHKGIGQLMIGNHTKQLIDSVKKPLLLIPPDASLAPIKKIAFATDLEQPELDLESIYNLVPFARSLDAEILITHVNNDKYQSSDFKDWLKKFLTELSNKADYPHIYYRIIRDSNTETGLDWLCEHGHIDMLAMVHRPHSFFERVLKGSHTQRMAGRVNIPLLVIPSKKTK